MKKQTIMLMLATAGLILQMPAHAQQQVFPAEAHQAVEKEKAGNGVGTLYRQNAFVRGDAKADEAIKEAAWLKLKPGDSIGLHKHEANEDAYIIVSGEGLFTDGDNKETPVKAGDITIARKGQSHALKNTGKEDLVFISVIAQQ